MLNMEHVLIVRETIVKFFKRYEAIFLPVLKFLLALFVFSAIQGIGHPHASLEVFMEETPIVLNVLFALLFTVMPSNMGWLLLLLSIVAQFSSNLEVAIAVFLFLLFIFIFYVRMAPKESIFILFTIIAYHFNVPYIIPLIAGLYFPITVIIPITLGVFINTQIPAIFGIMEHTPSAAAGMVDLEIADLLTELPEAFSVVYETLMHSLTVTQTWLFTAAIFVMVTVLVYIVSRLRIDFAKEIAIVVGCLLNIIGFILMVMADSITISVGNVIAVTLICGIFAWLIRLFDSILDYQRAETVQFEDDDNYYHVRVVPKVVLSRSKRVVKRIRPDEGPQREERPRGDWPRQETTRRPRPSSGVGQSAHSGGVTGRMPRPEHTGELPAVRRRPRPSQNRNENEEIAYHTRQRPRPTRPQAGYGESLENMPVRRPMPRPAPPPPPHDAE